MALPFQPWRSALQPASFRGAGFHVEVSGQAGGRRNVLHEFPKRDTPWAEDMGRRARRWTVSGYILGPTYTTGRDALIAALDAGDTGTFVHPTLGTFTVNAESYSTSETRERGGICTFEMVFVEAGSLTGSAVTQDTASAASTASQNLGTASASSADSSTRAALDSGGTISA